MHDIFLSYSRNDKNIMRKIKTSFEKANLNVWIDEHIPRDSSDWQDEIDLAIQAAKIFVCILSPSANNSRWVKSELRRADEWYAKPIFLILAKGEIHESIPMGFENYQFTDIRDSSKHETELRQLIEAVGKKTNHENLQVVDYKSGTAKYKTGQRVPSTSKYIFNGFLRKSNCSPTTHERIISLAKGEIFPPIRSCNAAAWWRKA